VSQFSSKKEKIILHLKIVFKDCQSVNYCNFLKRRVVKEVFLFIIDFMASVCNYEQTQLSLKDIYVVPSFKKETQGFLPLLKQLVSSINYFQITMKVIKEKLKVWKITSLVKTGIFSVTPLF
jgi:hypothetical protein